MAKIFVVCQEMRQCMVWYRQCYFKLITIAILTESEVALRFILRCLVGFVGFGRNLL